MSKKSELVGNYFGTIYLTVISLLQGIVLSQWVPNMIAYSRLAENPFTDVHLLPLVLMLLIIFNVWHHYAIGIFFLRWFPNIIDTLIPFVISIAQFFLISYLTITKEISDIQLIAWMQGFAAILLMGCFGYFAASWRLDPELFTNIMSKQGAVMHVRISKKYYMWSGFSVLFMGFYATFIAYFKRPELLWGSLVFFIIHLAISEYFLLRSIKPHFVQAMDEQEEQRRRASLKKFS